MRRKEGQKGEYNAFFYTIVSKETAQAGFYERRQKSLMDLGISFEVIEEKNIKYDEDIFDQRLINIQSEIEGDTYFLDKEYKEKPVEEES